MRISNIMLNGVKLICVARLLPRWLQPAYHALFTRSFRHYAGMTAQEVLEKLTSNGKVRQLEFCFSVRWFRLIVVATFALKFLSDKLWAAVPPLIARSYLLISLD